MLLSEADVNEAPAGFLTLRLVNPEAGSSIISMLQAVDFLSDASLKPEASRSVWEARRKTLGSLTLSQRGCALLPALLVTSVFQCQ
eukprot:977575-Amphidinium_carterae.1